MSADGICRQCGKVIGALVFWVGDTELLCHCPRETPKSKPIVKRRRSPWPGGES